MSVKRAEKYAPLIPARVASVELLTNLESVRIESFLIGFINQINRNNQFYIY